MANLTGWIPKYIKQKVAEVPGFIITSENWNQLWTLNIEQGDYNSETLYTLIPDYLTAKTNTESGLTNRYTKAETDTRLGLKLDASLGIQHFKAVDFNQNTGMFTFTRENGTTVTIDTALEKIALDVRLDPDTNEFVLTLVDGTEQRVDLTSFIDTYTFASTDTIVQTVTNLAGSKSISAIIKPGSIQMLHLEPTAQQTLVGYMDAAEASAVRADASKVAAKNSADAAYAQAGLASDAQAATSSLRNEAYVYSQSALDHADNAFKSKNEAAASALAASQSKVDAAASAVRAQNAADRAEQIVGGDLVTTTDLQLALQAHDSLACEEWSE